MEAVTTQVKEIPKVVAKAPLTAILIGLIFLAVVLIAEAYKPGLFTGPISHLLTAIGLKHA